MLLSNMLANRDQLQKGIDTMLRFFLPVGIALYGTQLTFGNNVEYTTWLSIILLFLFAFALTVITGRLFRLPGKLAILLASGLAVCGASAIAVVSPLIGAKKEDTSIAIISIMVVGLLSVVFYPALWGPAGLTFREFAFFSGTTIPMLGQVKIAVLEGGADGISLAVRFKLIRVSMLLFVAVAMLLVYGRRQERSSIPWFMVAFVVFVLLANFEQRMSALSRIFEPASKFCLSSALAAIGLSVDFDSITVEGAKPLYVVIISWIILSFVILAGLRLFHV
jgi:uncharacterized integral membrane protein (TIGR00698 family)